MANTKLGWLEQGEWSLAESMQALPPLDRALRMRGEETIYGTKGDDSLVGTAGDDTIDGRRGADTMAGAGGDDLYIVDNAGDLVVEADGDGIDTVRAGVSFVLAANVENLILTGASPLAGTGNGLANRIEGNQAANRLDGKDGDDTLLGHRGDDTLLGGLGADLLDGGQGSDRLDGGGGADTLLGRQGDDVYWVDDTADVVTELNGEGIDTVRSDIDWSLGAALENLLLLGGAALQAAGNELDNRLDGNRGSNLLDGAAGSDNLVGHRGDDTLLGGDGFDRLDGSAGNDSLDGGSGYDSLIGGAGDDTFMVDDVGDVVIEQVDGGLDTVVSTVDWTMGEGQEVLTLNGSFGTALKGYGNALGNSINGDYGENYIDGGGGNDTITGGSHISPGQSDTLIGGEGDDSITGGGPYADDFLDGGLGNDTLSSATGSLNGGEGNDLLIGGPGYGHHASGNSLTGGAGNDTMTGGGYFDGGDGDDLIESNLLSYVVSGTGNDTITGGAMAGYAHLHLDSGDGDDVVQVTGLESMTLQGGNGNDLISATGVTGVSVDGGLGNDTIDAYAGSGNSFLAEGGDGADVISAYGYGGTAGGGSGDDLISVSSRASLSVDVSGDDGNDTLLGGHGFESLSGGSGADTFVLSLKEVLWDDQTYLVDFASAQDCVAIDQSSLPVGNGDLQVDGAVAVSGPGGFDSSAELVIVTGEIDGSITLDAAAAAIGSANQAYTVGQTAVFEVGNGSESWLLYFRSSGSDALVNADELSVVAHLSGGASAGTGDVVWIA